MAEERTGFCEKPIPRSKQPLWFPLSMHGEGVRGWGLLSEANPTSNHGIGMFFLAIFVPTYDLNLPDLVIY
jgi:hypothetical protein